MPCSPRCSMCSSLLNSKIAFSSLVNSRLRRYSIINCCFCSNSNKLRFELPHCSGIFVWSSCLSPDPSTSFSSSQLLDSIVTTGSFIITIVVFVTYRCCYRKLALLAKIVSTITLSNKSSTLLPEAPDQSKEKLSNMLR